MKLSHVLMRSSKAPLPPPDFLELISTTVGNAGETGTNFSISLPATEPNDLVVVSLAINTNSDPTINSDGWTKDSLPAGAILQGVLLTKVVDGSESAISCTSSNRERAWVVRVYRSKTGRIPKISATSQGVNNTIAWDLPAITPDGGVHGTQKFTFIAAFACKGALNSAPAGYENYAQRSYNNSSSTIRAVIAQHESEAASDDPSTFNFASGGSSTKIRIQLAIWED